eukprot:m.499893 g.499893  ORF g.499893 m.499893 type:complete len:285 (+) comp21828_c0_seq21:168-1022(+)
MPDTIFAMFLRFYFTVLVTLCVSRRSASIVEASVIGAQQCGNTTTMCNAAQDCCDMQYSPTKFGCKIQGSDSCCMPGPPLAPSTTLKNCLIIGDSVSIGYYSYVDVIEKELAGICQVQHGPWDVSDGGAGATTEGVACLDNWLVTQAQEPVKWDVIQFNFGLHNLEDNTTEGLHNYSTQLLNITNRLEATGAKLLYALTTPFMPDATQGDFVVEALNKAAESIMSTKNIPLVDLYSVVTQHCGKVYKDCDWCRMHPCSYHYNPTGEAAQAHVVAAALKTALGAN